MPRVRNSIGFRYPEESDSGPVYVVILLSMRRGLKPRRSPIYLWYPKANIWQCWWWSN
jgi:hypothetical protein